MIGPYEANRVYCGHTLEMLRALLDNSISATITSPPYFGLRSYNTAPVHWPAVTFAPMAGLPEITIPEQECCLGLEADLWAYVGHLVSVFREVRRVLHPRGTLFLNLGDSYSTNPGNGRGGESVDGGLPHRSAQDKTKSGLPPKNLMMIPARVALALQADGWWLRSDIPWIKRNGMPGSQQDRPTTSKEYWFLLSKSERYYFDQEAVLMPVAGSTKVRLSSDIQNQEGSYRANGGAKSNGTMKAVGSGSDRFRRDTDWFFDSLRAIIEKTVQTFLMDEEGEPLALTVNPVGYKAAHFATFPPKLVEPMVLASTSREGVCEACGSPWVRVIEKKQAETTRPRPFSKNGNDDRKDTGRIYEEMVSTTTGWRPSCSCSAPTVPAVILDCFAGSGTTVKVAIANQRQAIGFDNNEEYVTELVAGRLNGTQIRLA